MNYNIRGENVEVTPAIREYVQKKLSKLEKFFDSTDLEARVNVRVYNDKQKVEVTIPLPHILLRAEESNSDLYASIDLVVDKLERQIRKHKTKVNRKWREKISPKHMFVVSNTTLVDESEDIELVRTKSFDLKPMDVEEAILQMNLLGHNFYVFKNSENNSTNVVYSRKDGKYGLIEAL
ncbi:MAG: Ribosome-associated factor [Bacillales bacterium]|jgi:putative sigma-54 modulation protein|nr:Ribosome-associated factor [Bacillales bacterium]